MLAALTLGFNLLLRSTLDDNANSVLRSHVNAAMESIAVEHGGVRVRETREASEPSGTDSLVWVFAGERAIEQPDAPPSVKRLARSLAGGPSGYAESAVADTRLRAEAIDDGGARAGTVVAGISLAPYERTGKAALYGSLLFAAIVLGLIVVAARSSINRALRPIASMTAEAAEWSEHDLDRRFSLGEPHDELTRLAATFDNLLDQLAAHLRHEQRFSAELSHELRNPLSAIVAESELALRRERSGGEYRTALERIASRGRQLEHVLQTLIEAARAEAPRGASAADEALERIGHNFRPVARERGVELRTERPTEELRLDSSLGAVERILSPVVENACTYAAGRVWVGANRGDGMVRFVVSDDGPGVLPEEAERIFDPGVRGAASTATEGAGLGLALSRRLAVAVGGNVQVICRDRGAAFEVLIPAARPAG